MYFKRPSFRRGGSTGIGQLTSNRQMYAGGGNIGGGGIGGRNLGTRTGFNIILDEFGRPYQKPPSTYKPNFNLKGSSYTPRNYPLTVIPNVPSGLSRLLAKYPKSVYGGGLTLGAGAGTGIGLLADAYQKATKTPLAYKKLKEVSKRPYYFDETNIDVGEGLDEIRTANEIGEAPGFFPRGGKNKFYEDRGLDPETGLPSKDAVTDDSFAEARIKMTDTPNYVDFNEIVEEVVPNKKLDDDTPKEPTFEDTYEKEKSRIEKLLGDDDQKGMAAIALSEAIGTPGTIADKAAVLNKSLLGIMVNKKKDKKDIAKLAYTATKEIEKAKIMAGKEGFSEKQFNRMKQLSKIISDTTGSFTKEQKAAAQAELSMERELIKAIGGKTDTTKVMSSDKARAELKQFEKAAEKLSKMDKTSPDYAKAYNSYIAQIKLLFNYPELVPSIKDLDALYVKALAENKKDGGRIGFANGTPMEESIQVSETVGQGEVPTAQTAQLSFEEIRNRLPKEITDDVVRLIAGSNEALQDFSYIRTQGDVDKFNMKYGVTLVLPQSTA